jgi:hypothetical protein
MPNRQKQNSKGSKMNKQTITEAVALFPFTSATAKSLSNRLESALAKEGSAHSRLKQASASLLALSDKVTDDQDQAMVTALGAFIGITAEIAREIKKAEAPAQHTPKTKRENWYDADSAEAVAIINKSAPKPKKSQVVADITPQEAQALINAILSMGK